MYREKNGLTLHNCKYASIAQVCRSIARITSREIVLVTDGESETLIQYELRHTDTQILIDDEIASALASQ